MVDTVYTAVSTLHTAVATVYPAAYNDTPEVDTVYTETHGIETPDKNTV